MKLARSMTMPAIPACIVLICLGGCGSEEEKQPRDLTVATSEPANSGRAFISDDPKKTGEPEIEKFVSKKRPALQRVEKSDGLVIEELRLGEGMADPQPGVVDIFDIVDEVRQAVLVGEQLLLALLETSLCGC